MEKNKTGEKKIRKKHRSIVARVIIGIVVVLACILIAVVIRYAASIDNFLNKITHKEPEIKQYSVVVLDSSEIKELAGINGKNVGFLKIDEKAGNAEQFLQEKVKFEAEFYDDLDTLAGVLNNKIVDAITIETGQMEVLEDEHAEAVKNVRVIYTFEIELKTENVEISDKQVTEESFILYISGSDSRNGIKATARSDVNIIAVVNPTKGKILLVSIPRDTYVQLHGTTGIRDKLTHAGVYGINMSKTTIEDFLGIKIDYTTKVSFGTVVKVVDELGGIEIESDQEMTLPSGDKKCTYALGKQKVDGACALRFARERKSYKSGDKHRGENQMQVISSIISKLSSSKSYVLNLPNILDIAADSFETSFTRNEITAFIRMQLGRGTDWKVESISIEGNGSMQGTYSMGVNRPLYVMIANPDSVATAQAKIKEYLEL